MERVYTFYSREILPLILMLLQTTNVCWVLFKSITNYVTTS